MRKLDRQRLRWILNRNRNCLLRALMWDRCHVCNKMYKQHVCCTQKYCSYDCAKQVVKTHNLKQVIVIPQNERKILYTNQIFKSSMFPTFLKGFLAGECV